MFPTGEEHIIGLVVGEGFRCIQEGKGGQCNWTGKRKGTRVKISCRRWDQTLQRSEGSAKDLGLYAKSH